MPSVPHAALTLPGQTRSVAASRRFAREVLSEWAADDLEWVVTHVLSELVTNAVIHAASRCIVRLEIDDERLRLEVTDGSRQVPRRRHYSEEATTGRGLGLVEDLTLAWGVLFTASGKTVWCEIARPADGSHVTVENLFARAERPGLGPTATGRGLRSAHTPARAHPRPRPALRDAA